MSVCSLHAVSLECPKCKEANAVSRKGTASSRPFRFTAEHFKMVFPASYDDSQEKYLFQRDKANCVLIALHANALLEAEEAKCERVYWYGNGEIHKCEQPDCEHTHNALLWNVAPIGANVQSPQGVSETRSEEGDEE